MKQIEWLLCPHCGNKTRNKIREDTILYIYAKQLHRRNSLLSQNNSEVLER